ncbi:26S proteasome regulatory subunit 6A [Tanacetum coccineum]
MQRSFLTWHGQMLGMEDDSWFVRCMQQKWRTIHVYRTMCFQLALLTWVILQLEGFLIGNTVAYAQLKAVSVEAGMLALRRDATEVNHEDFNEGIIQVQAEKKASLNYYA